MENFLGQKYVSIPKKKYKLFDFLKQEILLTFYF